MPHFSADVTLHATEISASLVRLLCSSLSRLRWNEDSIDICNAVPMDLMPCRMDARDVETEMII